MLYYNGYLVPVALKLKEILLGLYQKQRQGRWSSRLILLMKINMLGMVCLHDMLLNERITNRYSRILKSWFGRYDIYLLVASFGIRGFRT